jgi:hypothetical protein
MTYLFAFATYALRSLYKCNDWLFCVNAMRKFGIIVGRRNLCQGFFLKFQFSLEVV